MKYFCSHLGRRGDTPLSSNRLKFNATGYFPLCLCHHGIMYRHPSKYFNSIGLWMWWLKLMMGMIFLVACMGTAYDVMIIILTDIPSFHKRRHAGLQMRFCVRLWTRREHLGSYQERSDNWRILWVQVRLQGYLICVKRKRINIQNWIRRLRIEIMREIIGWE